MIRKKLTALLLALLMTVSLAPTGALATDEPPAEAAASEEPAVTPTDDEEIMLDGDTEFVINGVTVTRTSSSIRSNCYTYANEIYTQIWGAGISGGSNLLRGITAESARRMTAENVKNYISAAALGAAIRLTNGSNYNSSSEGAGHSQILVYKDSEGFTVLESNVNADEGRGRRERYMTWSQYADWWDGTWGYIQYIRWPGAPAYDGSVTAEECICIEEYAGWYTCTTTSSALNIRSGHGTSYASVGSIPPGAEVYVSKADGVWAHVEYNGVTGYASLSYLMKKPTAGDLNGDDRINELDAVVFLRNGMPLPAALALQTAVGL